MKKLITIIVIILFITGCNVKEQSKEPSSYYLQYNENEIRLGTFFHNTLATIGEYNNKRIENSNYYEGEATIYEYDTFEIETFIDNNIEKIYAIYFTSENQLTTEGLRIGDSKEKMLNVYKENYLHPSDNIFIYNLSNTNISFIIENDIIIDIIYYIS